MEEHIKWPQKGDIYYWFDSDGNVFDCQYNETRMDVIRQAFGNLFRTEEEAEEMAEQVKKALKCTTDPTPFSTSEEAFVVYGPRAVQEVTEKASTTSA